MLKRATHLRGRLIMIEILQENRQSDAKTARRGQVVRPKLDSPHLVRVGAFRKPAAPQAASYFAAGSVPGARALNRAMIGITISARAYAAIAATLSASSPVELEIAPDGEYRVWLSQVAVECLLALNEPGETFSDVILRLLERGLGDHHSIGTISRAKSLMTKRERSTLRSHQ